MTIKPTTDPRLSRIPQLAVDPYDPARGRAYWLALRELVRKVKEEKAHAR